MRARSTLLILKCAVSALLIALLLRQIGGIEAFSSALSRLSWSWCLAGAAAALVHVFLSGLNIWLLLRAADEKVPFLIFTRLYVHSYCFSLILPGQTGDAVIALFLKQRGVPLSTSGACYLIDKIITFSFMLFVSAYGIHLLLPGFPVYVLLAVAAAGGGAGLFLLRSADRIPAPFALMEKVKRGVIRLNETAAAVMRRRGFVLLNVFLTVVKWLVLSLSYFFVFRALEHPVPWPMVGVIPIMSTFVGYIPISIAGVGTVEYSAVYLFSLMGVPEAGVLATYFVQRLIQYALAVTLAALFLVFRFSAPAPLKQRSQETERCAG